ncbi:Protein phosphatase methylesterase 1 [Lunasporangiospora selenospora]|uniref:Protein phosphatase methylesterase 1 n=1 Tax=Lunasporangiospora selenospora TaxID=979761 RepID=A0A9P6G169_9FUNG|nr:Protein phosphatase methylesterase 1 [Lunasporangiospora selenospora]
MRIYSNKQSNCDDMTSAAPSPPQDIYSPLDWSDFFERKRELTVQDEEHQILTTYTLYESNPPPTVMTQNDAQVPVFVMHHGISLCGLSFALAAKALHQLAENQVRILAYDARGHGESRSEDNFTFSRTRLAKDLRNVILAAFKGPRGGSSEAEFLPPIILVGHSMGGAVATEAASDNLIPNLIGVAVLDMAECAREMALINIKKWGEAQPKVMASIEEAIKWGFTSGTVGNLESVRVSYPPIVFPITLENNSKERNYAWRTDILRSEPYWRTWFQNLNAKFLSIKQPKLLMIARVNYLDETLNRAHEEGQFQLEVFADCGHCLQEEGPYRTATTLYEFWKQCSSI